MGLLDIISIIIVFQLLLFSMFLIFTRKGNKTSHWILVGFFISESMVILEGIGWRHTDFVLQQIPYLKFIGQPFAFLWAPLLYLYTRSLIYKNGRLSQKDLIHGILFFIFTVLFLFSYTAQTVEIKRSIAESKDFWPYRYKMVIGFILHIQILSYVLAALIMLKRYQNQIKQRFSNIENITLSWLQYILLSYCLIWSIDVIRFFVRINNPRFDLFFYSLCMILFFFYFNVLIYKALNEPRIFLEPEFFLVNKKNILSPEKQDIFAQQIKDYFAQEKPYLNPGFKLQDVADTLQIPPRYVSEVISLSFGQPFYSIVSGYRIETFKRLAQSSEKKTVLELLFDSGFNSKSAFNKAFKKQCQQTPTDYLRSIRN